MVKIFEDEKTGEIVVWTSCLSVEEFLTDLAPAMAGLNGGDRELRLNLTLRKALPIAFKLAGYKADEVNEQRTLYCGVVSPEHCTVISKGGRE
jgi:hypothetical protein